MNTNKKHQFFSIQRSGRSIDGSGRCGSSVYTRADAFRLILLKSEGATQRINENTAATMIIEWMKAL